MLEEDGGCFATALQANYIIMSARYGESDLNTQEWTDGVLAIAVREAAKAFGDHRRQWVVLDGPVDAIWIENMLRA